VPGIAPGRNIDHAVRVGTDVARLHGERRDEEAGGEALRLSVVMPVYNEEAAVEDLVIDLERDLVPRFEPLEVIVIDDCSTDESPRILDRLAEGRGWLHIHHAERNAGHGPSVVRGLDLARSDWIFQLDSDRQFVVAEFVDLWDRRSEADLVLGVRVDRHDPLHRLVLSSTVRWVTSALARRRLRDANVPFRLFRRELWKDLRQFMGPETLAPSIFVTLGAVARGWRVLEVPVTHLPGTREVSTLRKWRLVKFSLRGLGELLVFRYKLARAGRTTRSAARVTT
jgi:dolichol-phosphate mannosyltransferase